MDKMETLKIKTLIAGIFGSGQGWAVFFYSEQCGVLLGNILKAVSIVIACVSGIYIVRIHQHRNAIKAIDEARAEGTFCKPCRVGKEPEQCPIKEERRPSFCPKMKRDKKKKLAAWKRLHGVLFSKDTTKT